MTIFQAHLSIASIEESGIISGIGATWAVNRNGFTTDPGAFAASIAQHRARGSMPAMLLHHDHQRPIGRWTKIEPRAEGLHVVGKLARDTQDGGEAYNLLRAGALSGLSVGLSGRKYVDERGEGGTRVRRFTEADLNEVSLVTVPADPDSLILTVASLSSARDIEDIFRQANVSGRKAKAAATAAWRAIDSTAEPDTAAIQQILSAASGSLSRFHRSK
ncbi:HK97 family phage prohead protease, partial [Staphylococcus aureus]